MKGEFGSRPVGWKFFGSIKDATVQQLNSAKRWSQENVLSLYLAGDHQSSF